MARNSGNVTAKVIAGNVQRNATITIAGNGSFGNAIEYRPSDIRLTPDTNRANNELNTSFNERGYYDQFPSGSSF